MRFTLNNDTIRRRLAALIRRCWQYFSPPAVLTWRGACARSLAAVSRRARLNAQGWRLRWDRLPNARRSAIGLVAAQVSVFTVVSLCGALLPRPSRAVHTVRVAAPKAVKLSPPAILSATRHEPDAASLASRIADYGRRLNPRLSPTAAQRMGAAIVKHARESNLDPLFVAALIGRESRFRPQARSAKGAVGLGQLCVAAARQVGIRNRMDIDQNVRGTCRYLAHLMELWADEADPVKPVLAAYLCGPTRVRRSEGLLETGVVRHYIGDILESWRSLQQDV